MSFNSQPIGATVSIDGHTVGSTPLSKVQVLPGPHHFTFSLIGYNEWQGDYSVFGQGIGIGIDFNNDLAPSSRVNQFEKNSNFINILVSQISLDWWAGASNQLHFIDFENSLNSGAPLAYSYTYDITQHTIETNAAPPSTIQDISLRQHFNLPARGINDVLTAAYISPSGRYILHTQLIDQNAFGFAVVDTKTGQSLTTNAQFSQNDSLFNDGSFYPVWSPDEHLVWLDKYTANNNPTIFILKNNQLQTLHFSDIKNGATLAEGGMFTRPSNQNKALVWANTYSSVSGDLNPRAPYLIDLNTMTGIPLPIASDDIVNPKGMLFSPDGNWIYLGTKEGIKRMNVNDLSNVEIVSDAVSQSKGFNIIDMSYTLDYALVTGSGANVSYFLYKMPSSSSASGKTPTLTPLAPTPTGASAPGGNQIGG